MWVKVVPSAKRRLSGNLARYAWNMNAKMGFQVLPCHHVVGTKSAFLPTRLGDWLRTRLVVAAPAVDAWCLSIHKPS